MLTPQDIQTKEFPKATFGGYSMPAVDDFLEELGTDYTSLLKENAVLKGKLKVLVDKVEEYRQTEDSMRMALLTAQKMSDDMLKETQEKCDKLMADAQAQADERTRSIDADIEAQQAKLTAARQETEKFLAASKALVMKQAEFLSKAEQVVETVKPKEPEEPVFSPEAGTKAAEKAPETAHAPDIDVKLDPDPEPEPAGQEDSIIDNLVDEILSARGQDSSLEETKRMPDLKKVEADEDEDLSPRPKFNFDDLKFGSNYNEDK